MIAAMTTATNASIKYQEKPLLWAMNSEAVQLMGCMSSSYGSAEGTSLSKLPGAGGIGGWGVGVGTGAGAVGG